MSLPFPYTINNSLKAKRARVTIRPGGVVVVTKPKRVSQASVLVFLYEKSDWIIDKVNRLKSVPVVEKITHSKKEYSLLKQQALDLVSEKLRFYNQIYKYSIGTISIKNQKTRWGSCSRKGNLNFNYKIALIPERLADYIVVHELCHIGRFDHSKKFWDLIAIVMPDYKVRVAELKKIHL